MINKSFYDGAFNWVMLHRECAPVCKICGAKLFDYTDSLDEYFTRINPHFREKIRDVYVLMFHAYPFRDQDVRGVKHHIDYTCDITIDVCYPCHAKIHHSKEKKYKKFKPKDTEVDMVMMKNYVEGWRPDPHRFETYIMK